MFPKHKSTFAIEENSFKANDATGVITFPKGLTITDDSEQWNGTRYDIKSLDVSQYKGQLTADHRDLLQNLIGKVSGVRKVRNRVVIDQIDFAVEDNALARYAYNMIIGGYLTDFSIETVGPWPDEDGIYHDSKLVGLSVVVAGNNKSATINQVAVNSINQCKEKGIDVSPLQNILKFPIDKENSISDNNVDMFVTVRNKRKFEVEVVYTNAAGDEVKTKLAPNATLDISEDQKNAVEKQINDADEPKAPEAPATPAPDAGGDKPAGEGSSEEAITKAVQAAMKPLTDQITTLEQKVFDNSAGEPTFKKVNDAKVSSELSAMDYRERHGKQINLAWDYLKGGNQEAIKKLNDINSFHLEALKKEGKVSNAVSLGDFGNFVISPELLTEIAGFRSNYQPLVSRLNYRDTLSLSMAWLARNGDIDMQSVEFCDDGADGNLKPISDYGATIKTKELEELAAVTPVCNAATRFLAADILGDVAAGYRTDFDRKRAQLFIARLQQAVNANGNTAVYSTTSDVNALKSWIGAVSTISEEVMNGTFILNNASRWEIISRALGSGISGDILGVVKSGDLSPLLGAPAIVVPNDLLPTLNTAQTKTFVVDGANVTINKAVFYVDLNNFTGRTSGGLSYDLSTEAAYEDGEVVKSAFQRNELVLRGSFFRGGAILNEDQVAALGAPGVS